MNRPFNSVYEITKRAAPFNSIAFKLWVFAMFGTNTAVSTAITTSKAMSYVYWPHFAL
jgi:hypothetical protein